MKKRVLLLVLGLSILTMAGGCKKKDLGEELTPPEETTNTTDNDAQGIELPVKEAYEVSEYITLGQYKGIEITVEPLTVTDVEVDDVINDALKADATMEPITDRPVQKGDTVNIDYEGLMDGVAFEGGTAQGHNLEIGSNSFVPGFEDGIIGANVGDKLELNLTFPTNYYEELAGKAVVFNVTVNSISQPIYPELTEAYVQESTEYETIDAYRQAVREDLEAQNAEEMENEKIYNLFTTVIENADIKSFPQTLIDYYSAQGNYLYTSEASAYGMDLESYVSASGITMEEYNEYIKSYAENFATQELILQAVANTESIEVSNVELQEEVEYALSYYGVETEDELFKIVSKDQIKNSLIQQKAYDFIVASAVVK